MTTLHTDDWDGVLTKETETENVGWEAVEYALRRLDGRRHTQLGLLRGDGSSLMVGGGAGRYNVALSIGDDSFLTLLDLSKPEGIFEELVVGGQLGNYPARTVVGFSRTYQATRVYFDVGTRDYEQMWAEVA